MKKVSTPKSNSWMTFTVEEQQFALPLMLVEGTVSLPDIVAIPGNRSRFLEGLSYVLGQIVAVIDLRPLANLRYASKSNDAIVVRASGYYYALRVTAYGAIVKKPKVKLRPKRIGSLSSHWFELKGTKIVMLEDLESLIANEICR